MLRKFSKDMYSFHKAPLDVVTDETETGNKSPPKNSNKICTIVVVTA